MRPGDRIWIDGVELTPEVREIAVNPDPADIAPYLEDMAEGSIELGRCFDPITFEHNLTPQEWAVLTEHVVVSDEPGEL